MSTIKRFEYLDVWKLAFETADVVYDLTLEGPLKNDFALRDQIRKCAISIFSNIAEGFERDGNREFINFYRSQKVPVENAVSNTICFQTWVYN